jgi:hypothetical protein
MLIVYELLFHLETEKSHETCEKSSLLGYYWNLLGNRVVEGGGGERRNLPPPRTYVY